MQTHNESQEIKAQITQIVTLGSIVELTLGGYGQSYERNRPNAAQSHF
jgi:hypothetical protein